MGTGTLAVNDQQNQDTDVSTNNTDIAIKPENFTYYVFVKTDAEGRVSEMKVESRDKQIEKLKAEDSGYTLVRTDTVRGYEVGSVQGLLDLLDGDQEEAKNIINSGLQQKFANKVKRYLTDFNEDTQTFVNPPVEDVIDSREWLQEPTSRRNLSPIERAMKMLKNIPNVTPEMIQQFVAQIQAAQSAQV